MRIVHTVASIENESSGVTAYVKRLAEELGQNRSNTRVEVFSIGERERNVSYGYQDIRFAQDFASVPLMRSMCLSKEMRQSLMLKKGAVDVVHNHGLWLMPNVYCGKGAGGRFDVPLIISPHGMLSPAALQFSKAKKKLFWYGFQRKVALCASCFHATCKEEYEDIRAAGITAPVAVVPIGIDLPLLDVEASKVINPLCVTSVGRLHPKKGLDRLVKAWARLEDNFPGWELLIAGPDEKGYARTLKNLIADLGLRRVTIAGAVYGRDKHALLAESELFVLPTLSENFALTVAESLAAGTPVIATKGAPWQGLVENRCGWWIDHGVDALAYALREAMSMSPGERGEMGRRGRAWMGRDFSWKAIASQMLAVYSWLSSKGDRPSWVWLD